MIMTEDEMFEGNELIAKFIGLTFKKDKFWVNEYHSDHSYEGVVEHEGWWKNGHPVDYEDGLLYDVSWDWIMPVVKKISDFDSSRLPKESEGWWAYNALETYLFDVNIKLVFQTCIQFIKWYNQNETDQK